VPVIIERSPPVGAGLPAPERANHGTAGCALRDHRERSGETPSYFGELFGWEFDASSPVAEAVSEPANYGFMNRVTASDGAGIPGGVGGGAGYEGHVVIYVGVPDVEAALQKAGSLGGKRRMGIERAPAGLVAGHFTDPEGNLIGVAGTA
jgi:predicted enzyme related to lactoylglutathione lyase